MVSTSVALVPSRLGVPSCSCPGPFDPRWGMVYCSVVTARILGATSKVEVATAGRFRQRRRGLAGRGARGSKQMADNLSTGDRVRLHSLQAAAQHNGVDGHLLKWNASTGRWGVKLSTGRTLSLITRLLPSSSHSITSPSSAWSLRASEGTLFHSS